MAMIITTNIASLNSQRYLDQTQNALQTAMQQLSSGLRVNSAADDPSGLAISDGMTSQINGMTVAVQNANDGISMVQTADGAMASLTSTLQTMRDLAVQASNFGTVGSANREQLSTEFKQLSRELGRVIGNTQFNGKTVLNGSLSHTNFQIGANVNSTNQISVNVGNLLLTSGISAMALQGTGGAAATLSIGSGATSQNTRSVISTIDIAIKSLDTARATLGALQNRFTDTITNLQDSIANQSASRSRIRDTDFAATTSTLSKEQILQQAGTAMLAQANQSNQNVMQLLK
ncbi:flagellin [Methylomonas sp. AM2-LC]|uniref:flagellin N-terminal helical domain-containing protein n=1 Tax=Methylomonas sp. AM2-LC TaxID=3153301 RepID=UPI003265FDAE